MLKDALNKYYEKERVTAKWIVKGEQARGWKGRGGEGFVLVPGAKCL